jgi:hypothetical protein
MTVCCCSDIVPEAATSIVLLPIFLTLALGLWLLRRSCSVPALQRVVSVPALQCSKPLTITQHVDRVFSRIYSRPNAGDISTDGAYSWYCDSS